MPVLFLVPVQAGPSCGCCGRPLPPGEPPATLVVIGPEGHGSGQVFGEYCGRCWDRLSVVLDALEELGRIFDWS
jgi:hypothetical protein